jgi:hypothetical protein
MCALALTPRVLLRSCHVDGRRDTGGHRSRKLGPDIVEREKETLMRTKTARRSRSAVLVIAAGLALAACAPVDATTSKTPSTASSASSAAPVSTPPTAQATGEKKKPTGAATKPASDSEQDHVKCTNQINYGNDARTNAEINSVGEQTGHCPPVSTTKPAGTLRDGDIKCTNQIDYAKDGRSNAEINTIGEETGYCPPIQP